MDCEAKNGEQLVNELTELRSIITELEAKLQALDEAHKALQEREKRYRQLVDKANRHYLPNRRQRLFPDF